MTLEARKIRLVMELRRQGVTDKAVLSAIERVPRENFVPPTFHDQAYENTALPIGHGQTISQPAVVAFMTQALEIGPRMKVLEVGTGCGYQAAVLARLCRRVYTIERHRDLLRDAEARFSALRIRNITSRWGDGTKGWSEQAPFDRIIVTAGAPRVPDVLFEQLAPDGILIAPVGRTAQDQALVRYRRTADGWDSETLWPVRFVPLVEGSADNSGNGSGTDAVRVWR
jgi:protein-L-isoaspartate(D-aspartate) O-methyltransferase